MNQEFIEGLNIIVAADFNNVIGKKYTDEISGRTVFQMPWGNSLKADLKHFKKTTDDSVVAMGYNTFLSLGKKPLPNRVNIVITKNHGNEVLNCAHAKEFNLVTNFDSLIEFWKNIKNYERALYIIGGKQLYDYFWDKAETIYRTTVLEYEEIKPDFNLPDHMYKNIFEKSIKVKPIDCSHYTLIESHENRGEEKLIFETWKHINLNNYEKNTSGWS